MILLGLDFETTGLDTSKEQILEMGACVWNCTTASPLRLSGALVTEEGATTVDGATRRQRPIPPEITALTGITEAMIASPHTAKMIPTLRGLAATASHCDAIVAHSGLEFDRPLLLAHCELFGITWPDLPWIDTKMDLVIPPRITTRNLTYLCAEAGFVNPFPHRALTDVLSMLKLFQGCYDDTVAAMERQENGASLTARELADNSFLDLARSPLVTVEAEVSFAQKDLAKERGYYWQAETKRWLKSFRQCRAVAEVDQAPFKAQIIEHVKG